MEYERDFEIVDRLARIETKLDVLSDLQARVSVLEENANLTEVFGRLL